MPASSYSAPFSFGSGFISGVTDEVAFPLTKEHEQAGALVFKGSCETKVTAFAITRPEFALMGVGLKTGDAVKLTWSWHVALETTR